MSSEKSRLQAICKATDELDRCVRAARDPRCSLEERVGATLGECDWYAELHKLLYREGK